MILVWEYYPTISETYIAATKPLQSRNFQVPMYIFLSGYHGFAPEADISITLDFICPNETLVINEIVNVSGTVILHDPAMYEINYVEVGFQNSLGRNLTDNTIIHNLWGEPLQGSLRFGQWTEKSISYVDSNHNTYTDYANVAQDNIAVSWSTDGDYRPIIQWFFSNGTSQLTIYDEVVIHVYPQEQLTQIETNRVSISLSVIVLAFSTVGIAALVVQILDRTENECKYTKDQTDNKYKCPYVEDKRRTRWEMIKQKNKTRNPNPKSTAQET